MTIHRLAKKSISNLNRWAEVRPHRDGGFEVSVIREQPFGPRPVCYGIYNTPRKAKRRERDVKRYFGLAA